MKKVKFNVRMEVHMIPDEYYSKFKSEMSELKSKSYKDFQQRILAGSEYAFVPVNIGDILDVPDWWFEAYCNDIMQIGISLDQFKSNDGKPIPFKVSEAIKHGHMKDEQVLKTVKKFDLIEEPILTHTTKGTKHKIDQY